MISAIENKIKRTQIYKEYYEWKWRERVIHKGSEYPDNTFYVIRRHANQAGLFSFVCTNLGSICEAVDRGYIPIVDMQNSKNPMIQNDQVGSTNAWELFFKQPCGYSLADIRMAKNIVLSKITPPNKYPEYDMLSKKDELSNWKNMSCKYIHPREEFILAANNYREKTFGKQKVLGVLCRGTDYIMSKPKDHPIQPSVEEMVRHCKDWIHRYGYEAIYIATEDEKIFSKFNEAFPNSVYSYQINRFSAKEGDNINNLADKIDNPLQIYTEYFVSILVLSQCDGLIAGATNGTYGALLLTKGYDHQYIYQYGRY